MSFVDSLKEEIKSYQEKLSEYRSKDFAKSWETVDNASHKAIDYYDSTFYPLTNEYEIVCDALRKIPNFLSEVSHIERLVTDDAKRKNYKKLLEIKEAVRKAFPNGLKVKEGEYEVVVATENLKQRKDDLSKRMPARFESNLDCYMDSGERLLASELVEFLVPIALCWKVFPGKKYPNLIYLLTITTLQSNCACCCPEFGSEYSIVFREQFSDFCIKLEREHLWLESVNNVVFQTLSNDYIIDSDRKIRIFSRGVGYKGYKLLILNEKFLIDLLHIINEDNNFDIFSLADYLRKKYGFAENEKYELFDDAIKELSRLYRETPAQIMVTEQRYYQEKQLEQLRENARQEQEQRERQAEQERAEYAYQEEQNRKQRERQAERERRESVRREEENRRQRERDKESKERDQMHLCMKCAYWRNGCRGGILGCGSFKPKR